MLDPVPLPNTCIILSLPLCKSWRKMIFNGDDYWLIVWLTKNQITSSGSFFLIGFLGFFWREHFISSFQFCKINLLYYISVSLWYFQEKVIHLTLIFYVYGTDTLLTRSIQRTQTPPRLWPLTLSCDLDLKSSSNRLMSLYVAYCIVPWYQVWCLWV